MVREVLTISCGQAGVQLGDAVWRQYCAEHDVSLSNGKCQDTLENGDFGCFFEETNDGLFFARNLSVDLEPNVIDDIRNGTLANLFDPEFLLNGKEDAANNFARGYYSVGKEIIDQVNDKMRKLLNNCDNVQGFLINHSVGGGTGSGLGSLILENINVDYRKKSKLGFEIYPSSRFCNCVVEPYNSLLTTHWLLDDTNVSLMVDNEAIYGLCEKNLNIKRPSYDNLNRLIAKVISSMTTSLRFNTGELKGDLNEFQTNLVPFPRLHFMISSMAPLLTHEKLESEKNDAQSISETCFSPNSFLVKLNDYESEYDKFMAISLNYSGDVKSKEANAAVQWLKNNKKCTFVEWCPTGFKVGLNERSPALVDNDDIGASLRNVTMIGNNTGISRVFTDRISKKYDLMYSQKAFVHWYVGEGMEEFEFEEARENVEILSNEYLDVSMEDTEDEGDHDDEFFEKQKYYFAPKAKEDSPCPDLQKNLTSVVRWK